MSETSHEAAALLAAQTRSRPPRDGLYRAVTQGVALRASAAPVGDDGEPTDPEDGPGGSEPVLFGYFSVFNRWTEIDSWYEGNFLESVAPGAYRKTFREQRDAMRVLFQHGFDPQIGDKPLGPIDTLEERTEGDVSGAYYEVPLIDTRYNSDLIPGLRAGLYGASFRFRVIREEYNEEPGVSDYNPKGLPERVIKEAQVLEFGPVTFPAYQEATAGVRSLRPSDLTRGVLRAGTRMPAIPSRVGQRATTGEYQNALEGLQSIAEAIEAALNQVGLGDTDEPGDAEDVSSGPFTDEQYADALETVQSLVEAAEGLLEGVGFADPDTAADALDGRSSTTKDAPSTRDAGAKPHLSTERRDTAAPALGRGSRKPLYGSRQKESTPSWKL